LGHDGVPGMTYRIWGDQAAEFTKQSGERARYRSVATHAEVKLKEALERCNEAIGAHLETERHPHKLRSAVCCKLFSELSRMAGPFNGILSTLCTELVKGRGSKG